MNDSYSILIIEDEKNIQGLMSRTLKTNGYKVTTADTGKAGLAIINSQCLCQNGGIRQSRSSGSRCG